MYTIIGTANSRTLRVLWMLEELGVAYQHVPANPRSDSVVEFNPAGKVPVLIVDGTPITDFDRDPDIPRRSSWHADPSRRLDRAGAAGQSDAVHPG